MAPLASAFIRLRSDSSFLASDVRRDATKAGAEGGTVMGREFGTAFRRVSRTLIGLGIGTFAVEAGRYAIDMADKFELSRSRLETVTKNLGGDFTTISGQVTALDDRLAAFGFTNADVEGSVASLESATKSLPKALKDTALAADIARGRNISLESATLILMRVETGHVAMLSRLGIATKDAAGHILTQKEALAALTQLYGGAAAHFAGTFAGKQQALRAELGNSAAEIGVALLPAVVDLAKVLQHDVLPAVQSTAQYFDRNRKTIEPLVGLVVKLALAYKALKLAQKGLATFAALRGAGAAGIAGPTALGTAASLAKPVPVFVTNEGFGPGGVKVPPVVSTGSKVATAAEDTAAVAKVGAVEVGSGIAGRPVVGFNSVKTPGISATDQAAITAAFTLIRQLPHAVQAQATKALGGSLSQQTTGSALHNLFLGPNFKTVVDTQKLGALEAQWRKLVPAVNKGATAEKNAGQATKGATSTLHDQVKALAQHQAKALALSQGVDDLRSAIHNMAVTAGTQGSKALRGNSAAVIANRDAIRQAVTQAQNYVAMLKKQGVSAAKVHGVEVGLAKAIKQNAINTYGNRDAVQSLLGQLGYLPGMLQKIIDKYTVLDGFNFGKHAAPAGGAGNLNPAVAGGADPTAATKKKATKAGEAMGKAVVGGYTPVVTQGMKTADQALKAAADKAAAAAKAAFDKAQQQMRTDFAQMKQYYASQRASLISTFSTIDPSAASTDLLGTAGAPTPFLTQLSRGARDADTFTRLWLRLDSQHLDPRLLQMFEGLGPEAIPTMRLWAQHPRSIRRANRLESRIGRDASQIASTATQDKYGPLIHQDLRSLPEQLGTVLRRDLKHLHINLDLNAVDRKEGRKVQQS